MSNFDLGQAVAGIGGIWSNKLENDQQQTAQKFQQNLAMKKLEQEQQQIDASKQAQAQAHAHQIFTQVMALQAANPGGMVSQKDIPQEVDPLTRSAVFENVAPNAGSKIYTSPDAAAPEQVGVVPEGMAQIKTPFNAKLAVAQVGAEGKATALAAQQDYQKQLLELRQKALDSKDAHDRDMYMAQMMRLTAQAASKGGLDANQAATQSRMYNAEFTKNTANDRTILDNAQRAMDAMSRLKTDTNVANRGPYEKNIIDAMERTFNPGSIVRQQTLNQDLESQSLYNNLWGRAQKIQSGGMHMTDADLHDFIGALAQVANTAKGRWGSERSRMNMMIAPYAGSDATHINPDAVMGPDQFEKMDLSPYLSQQTAPGSAPAGKTWVVGPDGKLKQQ